MKIPQFLISCLTLVSLGCFNTDDQHAGSAGAGNPENSVSFNFLLGEELAGPGKIIALDGINSFVINFKRISLSGTEEQRIDLDTELDLVQASTNTFLQKIGTELSSVDRIRLDIHSSEEVTGLTRGASMLLDVEPHLLGETDQSKRFIFLFDFTEEIDIRSDESIDLLSKENFLDVIFYPQAWFSEIDFSSCLDETLEKSGLILISKDSDYCTEELELLEQSIRNAVRFKLGD